MLQCVQTYELKITISSKQKYTQLIADTSDSVYYNLFVSLF